MAAALKQLWKSLLTTKFARKRLDRSASSCSSSWDSCSEEEHPEEEQVPKGCFAVYVSGQRFVVRTHLLSSPVFKLLLDRAAEEYGYEQAGGLTIPCDARLFNHILRLLDHNPEAGLVEVNELLTPSS